MREGKLKLNIYIDEDIKKEFADICRVAGVSQTSVVEDFLVGYVEFMRQVKQVKELKELDSVMREQVKQINQQYTSAKRNIEM